MIPNRRYGMCASCGRSIVFALPGAAVSLILEVGGKMGEDVVRTVSENATALKFDHASFEKD